MGGRIIYITVRDRIAVNPARTRYVCGNSDYVIHFDFDEEWNEHETKTARFVYGNSYQEQVFTGTECPVPIIGGVGVFEVGVYAGNLYTTTPARVPADKSILCKNGMPADPAPNVYAQIMEKLNSLDSGSITDPGVAHQQLVSDAEGKAIWEERTHYKETTTGEVVNLPETAAAGYDDDDSDGANDTAYFTKPWTADIVAGNTYTVTYNGVDYECLAGAFPDESNVPFQGGTLLGKLESMGLEGGNPDAPFVLMCVPNAGAANVGGMYGIMFYMDGAETVTLAIRGIATTTVYKTLEECYLPENVRNATKQITLTIAEDGTVTSDTGFETAWAMTDSQLQAAITVKKAGHYYTPATYASGASFVTRMENESGLRWLQIRVRWFIDFTDVVGGRDSTNVINWINGSLGSADVVDSLPHRNGLNNNTYYLRYNGKANEWRQAELSEVKADLGILDSFTLIATLGDDNAITITSGTYYSARDAYQKGQCVRLLLTNSSGEQFLLQANYLNDDDNVTMLMHFETVVSSTQTVYSVVYDGKTNEMTLTITKLNRDAAEQKVILPETELTVIEDEGIYLMSPWAVEPVVGGMYKVTYDGAEYECEGVEFVNDNAPDGVVLMGNVSLAGQSGGNADAPFVLMCLPNAIGAEQGGIYCVLEATALPTSYTISIVQTEGAREDSGNGGGMFIVNVPFTGFTATGTNGLTMHDFGAFDKSFDELMAAHNAGKHVRISANNSNVAGCSLYGEIVGCFGAAPLVRMPHNSFVSGFVTYVFQPGENGEIVAAVMD